VILIYYYIIIYYIMTTQITGLRIINNVITVTSHIPGAPTPDPGTPTPDPSAPTPKPGTPTCAPTVAPKPSPAIQSDNCLIQGGHYCIATAQGTKMGVSDATCQNTCRPGHQPWWPCNVGYCKDATTKPTPDPANLLDAPTGWSNDTAVIEYTCDAPGQDCINACCAVGKGCDPCGVDENMDGSCGSIGFMKNNSYQLTPENIDKYMKFSCKLPKAATFSNGTAISENYSKYIWDDVADNKKARNWCHGNNMHFDLSKQDPISPDNLVRYRPVSCKDHGWTKELATKIGQDGTGCSSAGSDDKDQQKFIDMYNDKTWAGWATTTYVGTDPQFCGGNIPHMNKAGMWKDDDGNPTSEEWVKTRLGAIPWVNICDKHGVSKDSGSKYGGSKVGYKKKYGSIQGLCWEIQELDGGMDILDSLQKSDGGRCDPAKTTCKSLSELKLVDKTKNQTYVIQAGTGCGGNCHAATIKDPFSGESKLVKATNYCPSDVNTCGCTPIGEGTTGGTSSKKCFYPPPPKDDKNTDSTTIPETINGKSKKFTVFDIVKGPDILDIAYNNLDIKLGKNCGGWGMGISKQDLDSPTNRNMTFNGFFQNCGLKYPPSNWPSKIVPGQNNYITIGGAMIWAYSKDFVNEMPKIDRLFQSTDMTGGYNCSTPVVTYGCTASVSKKTPPTLTCGFGLQDYYAGVDFDLEDGLLQLCYPTPGKPDWNPLIDYCNKIKKEGKKIQWTVSGNGSSKVKAATPGEYNSNTISINIPIPDIQQAITKNGGVTPFDTLSLMLYGGSMGTCNPLGDDVAPYGDWGLPQRYWIDSDAITNTVNDFKNAKKNTFTNTLGYLWEWYNAIKNTRKLKMNYSQINLGMSSINCTAGMVQLYTELCNTIGFAGILVWTISDTSNVVTCNDNTYEKCYTDWGGCCVQYKSSDKPYCNKTKCITLDECKKDGNNCPDAPSCGTTTSGGTCTSNKDCGIGSGGECMTCGSDNKCW
jgi:hypothetical protein